MRQQLLRVPFDFVQGYALSRTNRFGLAPRLAIDSADVATTSVVQGETYTSAARLGLPLALEAGVRTGWAGFAVPGVNLIVTSLVRRKNGLPTKWVTMGWQGIAVIGGIAIRMHLAHERSVTRSSHDQLVTARQRQAYLAGQSSVAAGADTAIDILIRTAPILEHSGSSSAPVQAVLSAWRQELASEVTADATYLRTALLIWRRRRNLQPDLSLDVDFDLSPDDGIILLSAAQVHDLERALDNLDIRGSVTVRVPDSRAVSAVGTRRELIISDHRLVLDEDDLSLVAPIDLSAAALLLGAALCTIPALPTQGRVPSRRAAIPVAWFAAGSIWARRQTLTGTKSAHDRIFLICATGCLIQALTLRSAPQAFDENGWVRQNYMWPVFAEIPLAYLYRHKVSTTAKFAMAAMTVAGAVFAYSSSRSRPRDFLYGVPTWTIAAVLTFRGLADALAAETASYAEQLRSLDEGRVSQSFRAGRSQVVELIREAHLQLCDLVEECERELTVADRDLVRQRLARVEEELDRFNRSSQGLGRNTPTIPGPPSTYEANRSRIGR